MATSIYELSRDVAIAHDPLAYYRTANLRGPATSGIGLGMRVRQPN